MTDTSMRACARQPEGRKMSTICLPAGMNSIIPWGYDHNWYSSRDHHAYFSKSNPQNKHSAKTANFSYDYKDLSLQRICAQLRASNHTKHPIFTKNMSTNLSTKSRSGHRCHSPKKFSSYEITPINQHESQKVGEGYLKHESWRIEVPNWEKYQIRKDLKTMTFFRVESRVFSDSKFRLLSAQAKLIWFYILSELSTKNCKVITMFCKVSAELCKVRTSSVRKAVSELESLHMLKVLERHESVPRLEKKHVNVQDKTITYTGTPEIDPKPELEIVPKKSEIKAQEKALNKEIWEAYFGSYLSRYSTEPVRNVKANASVSNLRKRLGRDAIEVVKFYLTCGDDYLMKNLHPLGTLLNQCETYHTRWKIGVVRVGNKRHGNFSAKNQSYLDSVQEEIRSEEMKQKELTDGKH